MKNKLLIEDSDELEKEIKDFYKQLEKKIDELVKELKDSLYSGRHIQKHISIMPKVEPDEPKIQRTRGPRIGGEPSIRPTYAGEKPTYEPVGKEKTEQPEKRGVWDRLKNWWHNMWYGRYDERNPYYHTNILGDRLGRYVKKEHISLSQYKTLKEQADKLENSLNLLIEAGEGSYLVLHKVVDDWANDFKSTIMKMASEMIEKMKKHPSPPQKTDEIKPELKKPKPTDEGSPERMGSIDEPEIEIDKKHDKLSVPEMPTRVIMQ